MKTKITLIAFACLLFIFNNSALAKKRVSDSIICLEITGRISNLKNVKDVFYKAELVFNSQVIDSAIVNHKKEFKFILNKNTVYGIKISKEGYASRIISIDTSLPEYANGYFRFQFDTELIKIDEVKKVNIDALDFPIAIISFNHNLNNFYYNEEYTSYIKRRLYLGTEF